MPKIIIIGAGSVGATLAYTLEIKGISTEIGIIDVNQELVRGEVMDMNHGLPFAPPVRIFAAEYEDCRNAAVIVITAGARQGPAESRLDLVERNGRICKSIVEQIGRYTTRAVLIVVTNPVDVMTYAVAKHSGFDPRRVIGSGTVLDSARFRYVLSRHCGVDSHNVHAYVVGEHGDSEVLLWSQVRMAGTSLELFCKDCPRGCGQLDRSSITEAVKNSAYHIIEAKGATNYGVALAVAEIIEAILRDENSVLTVSHMLEGQYGISDCCLSLPCVLNSRGVSRIVQAGLDAAEERGLRQSAAVVKSFSANPLLAA
jgi:L-lactate dehydrogenase